MTSFAQSSKPGAADPAIVLFDGVCGLCNGTVRWIIARDTKEFFRFAALDSGLGRTLRTQNGVPDDLDAVVVIHNERWYAEADAALFILRCLGGFSALGARFLGLFPRVLRDAIYRLVARKRTKWFGRVDYCSVRTDENRGRFLLEQ